MGECMMQDIPKLFQKEMGSEASIGFTTFDRWFTFSPAKNALEAGVEDVKKGSTAPATVSSAESDMYIQNQRKLQHACVDLPVTSTQEGLVEVDGLVVSNEGYVLEEIPDGTSVDEAVRIRGYTMNKRAVMEIEISEPGKYFIGSDGEVKKIE